MLLSGSFFYFLLSPTSLLLTARTAVLRRFFTPLPCQRDALDILREGYMKIVLINLFNAAKYKAGKYQMVPTLANTFCKFVKHFSFTMAGITKALTLAYAEINKKTYNSYR